MWESMFPTSHGIVALYDICSNTCTNIARASLEGLDWIYLTSFIFTHFVSHLMRNQVLIWLYIYVWHLASYIYLYSDHITHNLTCCRSYMYLRVPCNFGRDFVDILTAFIKYLYVMVFYVGWNWVHLVKHQFLWYWYRKKLILPPMVLTLFCMKGKQLL